MGGGGRYPYPKWVISPSGGWWARPANWRTNTAIILGGSAIITIGVWQFSAAREYRTVEPYRPIPSMRWAKQYKDREIPTA